MEALLSLHLLLSWLDHELSSTLKVSQLESNFWVLKLKDFQDSNTEGKWAPALFRFLFDSFVELCVSICIVSSLPLTKFRCVFFSVLSSLILDHFRKMNA